MCADTAGVEVTALPLSAEPRLFAFGEALFNFILIVSTSDKHRRLQGVLTDEFSLSLFRWMFSSFLILPAARLSGPSWLPPS